MRHAYIDAVERGPLTVEAACEDGRLIVVVTDEGRGMVPRADSPGLGLGLPLIVQLTQHVAVSDHAPGGTTLQMTFAVDADT